MNITIKSDTNESETMLRGQESGALSSSMLALAKKVDLHKLSDYCRRQSEAMQNIKKEMKILKES